MTRQLDRSLACDVRPAKAGDIAEIQATAHASWHQAYASLLATERIDRFLAASYGKVSLQAALRSRRSTFLIATQDGSAAGFCQFGDRGNGPELFRLYVHPQRWRQGIGRRLLSHVEMQFLVSGVRRYGLTVYRGNLRAMLFYMKHGFERQPSRDNEQEWYLRKLLVG